MCLCCVPVERDQYDPHLCKSQILLLPGEACWLPSKVHVAISPPDSVATHLVQTTDIPSCLLQECDGLSCFSLIYSLHLWSSPLLYGILCSWLTLTQGLLIGSPLCLKYPSL